MDGNESQVSVGSSVEGSIRHPIQAFREHPALWIGVILTGLLLVIAYKAYRAQSAAANGGASSRGSQAGTVLPGTGQPDWLSSGDTQGVVGNAEIQAELAALLAYLNNPQTPNSPGVANPQPIAGGPGSIPNPDWNFHNPNADHGEHPIPVDHPVIGHGIPGVGSTMSTISNGISRVVKRA